jgi:hypothetical protein
MICKSLDKEYDYDKNNSEAFLGLIEFMFPRLYTAYENTCTPLQKI